MGETKKSVGTDNGVKRMKQPLENKIKFPEENKSTETGEPKGEPEQAKEKEKETQ